MKISIDSKTEKPIEYFEHGVLYWHVPTGTVCILDPNYNTLGWGFGQGGIVDWVFTEPANYRKFNGVVRLSNK